MAKKLKEYAPTTYLDFTKPAIARKQAEALASVRKKFGKEYPLIINGRKVKTGESIDSLNPANISEVVGHFNLATRDHAEQAIQSAAKAFESWKTVPAAERADYLFRAAEEIRKRRYEINAWMISEVGKNYGEADADTGEAIDFLEFYGREMLRYGGPQPVVPMAGEMNRLEYLPLGVGAVIPPWNFPFAIMVGMTSASFVTGNTVVLKPSSDSPMMAWLFMDILQSIGLPKGVVNFIPGHGGEIGDYIVDHARVRYISFTGSAAVGKRINERAAKTPDNQIWLKRVVAEMGGKDAIIVDADTDVDTAVEGVALSAFGFQGQKCSACSRAIVDAKIYDEFIAKLKDRVESMMVGDPMDNFYMGPVSSERAYQGILNYIEIGKSESRLLTGGEKADGPGWFILPTVFVDVKANARISQEEIFGPVLAVTKSKNFDDALKIANGTVYGLTGAVYTNDPEKLERAANEFFVGNLYLNRKCTGALVGVHPFGGFNLSGTDSKAGGRDYLLLFMQAKSIAQKIMAKQPAPRKTATKSLAAKGEKAGNGKSAKRVRRNVVKDSGLGE
ncbi:MAG: L-glutamate gamma-semialdehyde dehydrogenase [Candidatus Kapaibacterium sp.]